MKVLLDTKKMNKSESGGSVILIYHKDRCGVSLLCMNIFYLTLQKVRHCLTF